MHRLMIAATALSLAFGVNATAQTYPSRSITMIVPFAAGGPTDALARILGERMRRELGQTIVVENTTGAAGSLAVARAVRAEPDGHTLSIGHSSTHVLNGAIFKLNYDLVTDLAPIALLASNPQIVVGNKDLPADDLKSLIAWLKANPGKASVGTAGIGAISHLGGVYFEQASKTQLQFIPYRGTGPAMQDMIAGQTHLMFDQSSNSLPQIRSKLIKPFAVAAPKRLPSAPDIPTSDEAGLPGYYVDVWHGLWAPKGTPQPIIDRLVAAVQASLADPEVHKRLADLGQEIPSLKQQTPAGLRAYQQAEIDKWWPIIRSANIKVQ